MLLLNNAECRKTIPRAIYARLTEKYVYKPTKQGYVLVPLYDIPEMEIGLKSIMAERFGAEAAKSKHCRL